MPLLVVLTDLDQERRGAIGAAIQAVVDLHHGEAAHGTEIELEPRAPLLVRVEEVVGAFGALLRR